MNEIASSGFKVVRVWGFGTLNNPPSYPSEIYFQTLNSSGQFFNLDPATGVPRLDYVVAQAEKLGLKLILALLNNFDDLGGINTYTNTYGGDHNGFYTNTAAQNAYKAYIKFIVERYRKSNAVFSWELANEPRCSTCSTDVITTWATDVSAYIKGVDKGRHMVSLGDEGWLTPVFTGGGGVVGGDGTYAYSGYEGVDFERNLQIKTLDYGTVHLYPNQWGYNYTWGSTWISQHNYLGKKYNKPVILEEYAAPTPELRMEFLPQWHDTILKKTSIAGNMVWQFGTPFTDTSPFDQYAVYYSEDPASEYQSLLVKQAKAMARKIPIAIQ
ncbi:uncharacterized protein KY384_005061 [Bacidia gigantensis]|uniref:uncharacterized protein n=1 Tax=Bacidia gigantensis TaxID=2732470 RepID=UPI001D03D5BD|nr:uncharacterized protein KY384_005061 [Bacidia gigantensis]KAG8530558.1 hypothetical protein KY384_005061 [Bacidia gigantensis]